MLLLRLNMPNHQLVLIHNDSPLDPKILESLHRKDYQIAIYSSLAEFSDSSLELDQAIILALINKTEEQQPFFSGLKDSTKLSRFPILAIAADIGGLESELNATFPLALVLKTPTEAQKILDSLRFLERNYKLKTGPDDDSSASGEIDQALLSAEFSSDDVSQHINQAKDLFAAIKDLEGTTKILGGEILATLFVLNTHSNKDLKIDLPADPVLKNYCNDFLKSIRSQASDSISRVNRLSLILIQPLSLDTHILDLVKAASILYCESFVRESRELLNQDYAFRGGLLLRKQLCSQIKDSALNLGSELAIPDLNSIVASVARIIGNEGKALNNQLAIAASAIALADLINRKCTQPLFWNFRNAQRILKAIRQGRFKLLHPAISCIAIRLISEALASPLNKRLLASTTPLGNPDLEGSIIVREETIVDLPELEPGMILSRALTAENGKEILNHDIVLDEDLIARIWQLSGICPLEKAVIRRSS
jgi:hypothetical protein